MFIERAGVIVLEPQKECKALFISDGVNNSNDHETEQCLHYDDPLLSLISKEKKLITEYDIAESPGYSSMRESCGQRFSDIGASVVIPLIYQDEVTGVLALGNKKSGHFYSREDIHLLETLTNQGAVAIENAKLAEQMKKEETVRTNLARYLSPQIVDDIVKNDVQVNLGGDRKTVSVLFSDIRNFTTITETRPPDQLVQILNEYFTEMARIIFENQGSLDKYIGDAIVAVFGSLIPLENHAKNAVEASIQMMKELPLLNKQWMKEFGFSMDIGIGVCTGEVFLGNIGSQERLEFTVIGDTVNVASRFSGLAKAGQILMTRETLSFLDKSDIKHKELRASKVKGKAEELEVFEVLYS
jgi:adenylate cyclase